MTVKIAEPPIQVWMPNQPQATPARMRAGRLAPKTPNDARAKTGYGMPYLVPAWLFSSIGTRTMMFASMIVKIAWYHAMPEGDEAGGQSPGRDVVGHPDPQGDVVVGRPGALRDRDRGQVLVVERRSSPSAASTSGVSSCRPSGMDDLLVESP